MQLLSRELLQWLAKLQPEIIWLDMHIAHGDSIAEIGRLRKLSPDSRIIALDEVEDEQEAFAAIMTGAQHEEVGNINQPQQIATSP